MRAVYDERITQLVETLAIGGNPSPGEVNYVISTIIWKLFDADRRYTTGNNLVGVLECVKQEFYRRKLAPYEDIKIQENGDICQS